MFCARPLLDLRHTALQRGRLAVLLLALVCCSVLLAPAVAAQQHQNPCASGPFRDFDFWVGSWDVTQPDGTAAGTNQIEKILNDCALQENWTGTGGSIGTSLNQYDWQSKVWRQTWVDGQGLRLDLEGGLEGDRMVLRGERPPLRPSEDGSSTPVLSEVSWTPKDDGSVVQHWRMSTDGGKTWTDAFIGIYRKQTN